MLYKIIIIILAVIGILCNAAPASERPENPHCCDLGAQLYRCLSKGGNYDMCVASVLNEEPSTTTELYIDGTTEMQQSKELKPE